MTTFSSLDSHLKIKIFENIDFRYYHNIMDQFMEDATIQGDMRVVDYFLNHKEGRNIHKGFLLQRSGKNRQYKLFKYILNKMGDEDKEIRCTINVDWQWVWLEVGEGGSREIVNLLMEKTAENTHDYSSGAAGACKGGNIELAEYCFEMFNHKNPSYNVNNFIEQMILNVCQSNSVKAIDHFIQKSVDNGKKICWGELLRNVAIGGHPTSIKHIIDLMKINNIEIDWNDGLMGASHAYHLNLVNFFITKGANQFKKAYRGMFNGSQSERNDEYIAVRNLLVPESKGNPYWYHPR